jgi:hypothetical protein
VSLFNAGAIGWWLQHSAADAGGTWRGHLEAFLRATSAASAIPRSAVDAARSMLGGQTQTRPFVMTTR